jgi:hypothetical protein
MEGLMEERKTIPEWQEEFDVFVVDPDGFDRSNPDLYFELFTEEEFMKGLLRSTCIFGSNFRCKSGGNH